MAVSTGAPDYLDIPPDTEAKKIGTVHAGLNATLLGMTVLNILLRKKRPEAPGGVPVALSLVGSAGIFVSAWYGGDLVYTHGIRVQDSGEGGSELAPPGGEKVEEVFRRVARSLPGSHEGM